MQLIDKKVELVFRAFMTAFSFSGMDFNNLNQYLFYESCSQFPKWLLKYHLWWMEPCNLIERLIEN